MADRRPAPGSVLRAALPPELLPPELRELRRARADRLASCSSSAAWPAACASAEPTRACCGTRAPWPDGPGCLRAAEPAAL